MKTLGLGAVFVFIVITQTGCGGGDDSGKATATDASTQQQACLMSGMTAAQCEVPAGVGTALAASYGSSPGSLQVPTSISVASVKAKAAEIQKTLAAQNADPNSPYYKAVVAAQRDPASMPTDIAPASYLAPSSVAAPVVSATVESSGDPAASR